MHTQRINLAGRGQVPGERGQLALHACARGTKMRSRTRTRRCIFITRRSFCGSSHARVHDRHGGHSARRHSGRNRRAQRGLRLPRALFTVNHIGGIGGHPAIRRKQAAGRPLARRRRQPQRLQRAHQCRQRGGIRRRVGRARGTPRDLARLRRAHARHLRNKRLPQRPFGCEDGGEARVVVGGAVVERRQLGLRRGWHIGAAGHDGSRASTCGRHAHQAIKDHAIGAPQDHIRGAADHFNHKDGGAVFLAGELEFEQPLPGNGLAHSHQPGVTHILAQQQQQRRLAG